MHITCNKSAANLNLTVSHDTSAVCGELLTDWTAELGSFWTEAATDSQRAISDVMISAECRHWNCNSYIQI